MSGLKVDLNLVQKYNVAGPRYTSYPPATKFTRDFSWPQLADRILRSNRGERDLSLYFHIPFCETLCWYCGCTTVITRNHNQAQTYLDHLEKEVAQMKGQPTFKHCAFYSRAIPQYNVGYQRYRDLMSKVENSAPGLFLAGHYRDGISLGDSIVSGCNAADRLEAFVNSAMVAQASETGQSEMAAFL
jgi:hypothetical protein